MRSVVWALIGAFCGWRAWRLAHRDIHLLREMDLTYGTAHVAHGKLTPVLWLVVSAGLWWQFAVTFNNDLAVIVYGLWSAVLLRLLLIDIDTHVLPRRTTSAATFLGFFALMLLSLFDDTGSAWSMLSGAVVLWVMLKFLQIVSRGDLGGGDVALGPLLGVFVGWLSFERIFVVVLAGFILGGLFAIGLVTLGRATRRTYIAFGPFLIVGAFVGVLR